MSHSETYVDGIWFPSVTTILTTKPSPWLDTWRKRWGVLAIRKMKIAGAIGTEFHRCVEEMITSGNCQVRSPAVDGFVMPSLIPRITGMLCSFLAWFDEDPNIIIATERKVISRRYQYSGTLDAVSRHMLYDWKTSGKIYDDMQLQLAAYAHAYNEQTGSRIKEGLIVCVSKDKPDFRLTTKMFKLGKRPFNKFLRLKREFDRRMADAEISVPEETGC